MRLMLKENKYITLLAIIQFSHILEICFMTTASGRMIPFLTLVSKVPTASERGSFMGALYSIRSCGSALSTLIAGLLISENSSGKLMGFDITGYLSVFIILVTIYLTFHINKGPQERSLSSV